MSEFKKSAKSVLIIIIFSLGSKVLGFIREALIASQYGSGNQTDTFFIALSAIALFSTILTKTINTTLIPILSDVEADEGKDGKLNHLNNFLNIITSVAFVLIILGFFLTPFIMKILARGFVGEQFDFAILLTRIGLPTLVASSIVGVFRGYLQSEELFNESAASAFPKNFVYIIFLILLAPYFDIKALMVASVVAELAQLTIQIPSLKRLGYKYKPTIDIHDEYMKRIADLIPPILISVAISDLSNLMDKSMASSLVTGSVSALNYASKLNSVVRSVFITAIVTVVFPIFSKEVSARNYERLKQVMSTSLNIVLLITIPAAVGMIVLSTPIVRIAYERGAFDETATIMTAGALIFYSMGLIGTSIKSMLNRVFYALQDTKTPMINGIYTLGLNFILNLIFIQFFGHRGLALATSISTTLTSGILLYDLRKKIGNLGFTKIAITGSKTILSAGIMGVVVHYTYSFLNITLGTSGIFDLVNLSLSALAGILIYFILLFLFKVEELHFVIKYVKNKF